MFPAKHGKNITGQQALFSKKWGFQAMQFHHIFEKKEYSYGNNVTRLMAKIVIHKEALICKKW